MLSKESIVCLSVSLHASFVVSGVGESVTDVNLVKFFASDHNQTTGGDLQEKQSHGILLHHHP